MKNEFGETITHKQVEDYVTEIRKLTLEQIDRLWFECEWIDLKKGKNKALSMKKLKSIIKEEDAAKNYILSLLMETPMQEFQMNLRKIICNH